MSSACRYAFDTSDYIYPSRSHRSSHTKVCLKFLVVAITKRSYQIILSADIHADLIIQHDVRDYTLF